MFWIKIHRKFAFQTKNVIFFRKTLFSRKNAVFYEEKAFFAPFFAKRANFRKKIASSRAPKETKRHKRRRMQFDDPNAFLGLFFVLSSQFSLNLRAFSLKFHKILTPISEHFYSILPSIIAFCIDYNTYLFLTQWPFVLFSLFLLFLFHTLFFFDGKV